MRGDLSPSPLETFMARRELVDVVASVQHKGGVSRHTASAVSAALTLAAVAAITEIDPVEGSGLYPPPTSFPWLSHHLHRTDHLLHVP